MPGNGMEASFKKNLVQPEYLCSLIKEVDLVPDNLALVRNLLWDARPNWFDLGLELGIDQVTLQTIKQDNYNVTKRCFNDMLSEWLKMYPCPSWKGLIIALKQPFVGLNKLAKTIQREQFGEDFEGESDFLEEDMRKDMTELQGKFCDIVDCAYDFVIESKITVGHFINRLANLPVEHQALHMEFLKKLEVEMKDRDIDCVWFRLTTYWNFLNYLLLERVVSKFGNQELKSKMESYKVELKKFRCNTRLCDFAKYYTKTISTTLVQKDFEFISMKMNKNWKECTLEDVENLAEKFTHKFFLPSFSMNLKEIKPGSIVVTWAVPSVFGSFLKEKMQNIDMRDFCDKHEITSISMNGEECKSSTVVKEYVAYLKLIYLQSEVKKFVPFKFARVVKELTDRTECDDFTKGTLRGNQDDLLYSKKDMNQDEIGSPRIGNIQPRVILIEGASGVGKTLFSKHACYMWSQGQFLKNMWLLVLLPLRDRGLWSVQNMDDLIQCLKLGKDIAEEIKNTDGDGVTLWFDGWDELGEEMRNKTSLYLDLIHGHILPKATVIITSRPWATRELRENTCIKVGQHVEIVSNPNHHVLKEDKLLSELTKLSPSIIANNMHTPVTANIVAEVLMWNESINVTSPSTMTQLYSAYTCKLLTHFLSSQDCSSSETIRSLCDIPTDIKVKLQEMCRMAWEGVVKRQVTFSGVAKETLGLMHGVTEMYGEKENKLSYHFIHLTLQEFLSAYYITQLSLHEQERIIWQHAETGYLHNVVCFFFGLAKKTTFTPRIISEYLSYHFGQPKVHHWLFEASDVNAVIHQLGSGKEEGVKSSYSWSPLDYYMLGHSIAYYQCNWQLDCVDASMGDLEIEMLSKGMASITEDTWKGEIECDFAGNSISIEGIRSFVNVPLQLAKHITILEFGDNRLDATALSIFCKLIHKLTNLIVLSFRGNPIGEFDPSNYQKLQLPPSRFFETPLASLLQQAECQCWQLDISSCRISSEGAIQLATPLMINNSLTQLDISCNPIGDIGATAFGNMIINNTTLSALDISSCGVTAEGCINLAAGLAKNTSLEILWMAGNCIGVEGAEALGKMMEENVILRELNLSGDNSLGEGVESLLTSLQKNTTMKELTLPNQYQHSTDSRVVW